MKPITIGLSAVILAVTDETPRVLTVEGFVHAPLTQTTTNSSSPPQTGRGTAQEVAAPPALPFAPLDPVAHRTLELGLRAHVLEQTGLDLGYVEQLYTFGDRDRFVGTNSENTRLISVAYLALTRETPVLQQKAYWRNCYQFFPWEDWREGQPEILTHTIYPALEDWIHSATHPAEQQQRRERAAITFGLSQTPWDGYRVLERYELLYEMGWVAEASRDNPSLPKPTQQSNPPTDKPQILLPTEQGKRMALDHRRILSTALGRMRGKIKYRPVVFELLPDTFTLLQLQQVVEALAGVQLHKQNFRRLVEKGGLVEGTGQLDTQTGGRPAELFTFRRDVLRERPTPGVGLPGNPTSRRQNHGSID